MSLWQQVLDKAVGVFKPSEAQLRKSARKQGEFALQQQTSPDLRGRSSDPLGDIYRRQRGPGAAGVPDLVTDRRPVGSDRSERRIFDIGITDIAPSGAHLESVIRGKSAEATKLNLKSMSIWDEEHRRLMRAGWLPEDIMAELGPRPAVFQSPILWPGQQALEDFNRRK